MIGEHSPTRQLAEFTSSLSLDAVPAHVREVAKDLLLDSIACALAADRGEETPQLDNVATAIGGDGTTTVIGEATGRTMASAVLLNGYRITAITACDVYMPAHSHQTPQVVPPALATAERAGAGGAELLTSVIVGLETAVRISRAMNTPEFRARGWHPPGIAGPFGGAVAAASLLGLDAATTVHALGIAGSQAAGTYAARGTATMKFHQARGALAGLLGALLAAEGMRGSSDILAAPDGGMFAAFVGDGDPASATALLGQQWELQDISMRRWPGGGRVQPAMTAALKHVQRHGIMADTIGRVTVRVSPEVHRTNARYPRPDGLFERLASIHHAVAVMLTEGDPSLDRFTQIGPLDPAFEQFLADKIEVVADDGLQVTGAAVEVESTAGMRTSADVEFAKGDPHDPLDRGELVAKARAYGHDRLGPAALDELIGRLLAIETEDDLGWLFRLLRGVQ